MKTFGIKTDNSYPDRNIPEQTSIVNNNTYINIQIIINKVSDLIELFWEKAKYANLCELLYFLQYRNHGHKMRATIQMYDRTFCA